MITGVIMKSYRFSSFLLFVLCFVSILNQVTAQSRLFHLNGSVNSFEGKYIYLITQNKDGKRIKDSSVITSGKFSFSGNVDGFTDIAYLKMNGGTFWQVLSQALHRFFYLYIAS